MGGGNGRAAHRQGTVDGLSPRGRGKLPMCRSSLYRSGSIPAWAGETRMGKTRFNIGEVYPRVGGGNRMVRVSPTAPSGLSPRGRGKPC